MYAGRDPLVSAIVQAVEQTLERGIVVTPTQDGWLIQVAPPDLSAPIGEGMVGRTW